jgi:hypothetical protein
MLRRWFCGLGVTQGDEVAVKFSDGVNDCGTVGTSRVAICKFVISPRGPAGDTTKVIYVRGR